MTVREAMIPATRTSGLTDNYIASSGEAGCEELAAANEPSWQRELAEAGISVEALLSRLQIPPGAYAASGAAPIALPDFPLRVTESFIRRMQPGDIHDPLLRQVLPVTSELLDRPGYLADPLREADFNPAPGLVKKYHGRALLIVTQACAIHCRYCFRKNFPYESNRISRHDREQTLQALRNDTSISEIILSGGDPLAVSDQYLLGLVGQLNDIPHIDCLRIHTRLPIVLPSRITRSLREALRAWRGKLVVVVHSNHAAELDADVGRALRQLSGIGATLLNQAVLLRSVNDSSATQVTLSRTLFDHGVLPYYLHQLDKVSGTSHFEVADTDAVAIHAAMRRELPGYLVPRLVREIAGGNAKTPVF